MKNVIPFFLLFIYLTGLHGCINKNKVVFSEVANETTEMLETSIADSPFSNTMKKALDDCIKYNESIGRPSWAKTQIFHISFYKKKGDCYVLILTQPFYFKERIIGYTYTDDYTIVVNEGNEDCSNKFVDKNNLILYQDSVPGFSDFHDYPAGHYEPFGIDWKIVTADSLQVIYKGMI